MLVTVASASTCLSFNVVPSVSTRNVVGKNNILASRQVAPPSSSRRYLFDPSMLKKNGRGKIQGGRSPNGSSARRVSAEEINFMRSGFGVVGESVAPPFPYTLNADDGGGSGTRLVIRHMEDEDIKRCMPEIVREFGALTLPTTSEPPEPGDKVATFIENYLFSLTVLIGLTQRVVRRQKGYSPNNAARPDHNVVCLVEQTPINNNSYSGGMMDVPTLSEQVVGIAELSWQPPNPNANAPPFVLPYFVKQMISRFGPSREGTSSSVPKGYVSNVLVWKTRRGRGYSRVLMAGM